jgi:uncharacterized protein (DUF427 family)
MSLTAGTGPFGPLRKGDFSTEMPASEGLFFVDASPRWVRARLGGETVADSRRMRMLHEHPGLPVYMFPREDVRDNLLVDPHEIDDDVKGPGRCWSIRVGDRVAEHAVREYEHPLLAGHLILDWSKLDEWLEEGERVTVHPRDPYHRVDVLETPRQVTVSVNGEVVAETIRARVLFETGLPPRWYIPADDVRMDLLEETDSVTACPYKGEANYWTLRLGDAEEPDVVWTYREPLAEVGPIAGYLAFFDERVDVEIDGERQARPITPWSVSSG